MERSRLLVTVRAKHGLRQATVSLIMTLGRKKPMNAPQSLYLRCIASGTLGMVAVGALSYFVFDEPPGNSALVLPWILTAVFGIQSVYKAGYEAALKKSQK